MESLENEIESLKASLNDMEHLKQESARMEGEIAALKRETSDHIKSILDDYSVSVNDFRYDILLWSSRSVWQDFGKNISKSESVQADLLEKMLNLGITILNILILNFVYVISFK